MYLLYSILFLINAFSTHTPEAKLFYILTQGDLAQAIWQHPKYKENIRLGNPSASDDEVFAAARAAQCEEFIQKLPQGYDTPAGEAGKRLSGGDKQRIAIARMILKSAPVVILDEATAFTAPENEEKIQQSIAALTKGKTLLVIAHRLSTIKNADNIVVLIQGEIVAQGK